jgi:hypothetical protein
MEGMETVDASGYCIAFIVFCGAAISFGMGLYYRLGNSKEWFLTTGSRSFFGAANYPVLMPLAVPLAIFGLCLLTDTPQRAQSLLTYAFLPSLVLALIVAFWRPRWLLPRWVRQLKENHPDIYPYLKTAAILEVGDDPVKARAWGYRMDTVEGQNEWVAEVRERMGRPDPRVKESAEEEQSALPGQ